MAEKLRTQKRRPLCIKCGSVALDNFYQSYNKRHSNGYLPYCKKCIEEEFTQYFYKYDRNIEVSLFFLSRMLDYPYFEEIVLIAIDDLRNRRETENNKEIPDHDIYKSYLGRLNNRFRARTEVDLNFDCSDVCFEAIQIDANDNDIKDRIESAELDEEEKSKQEIRDLRKRFGYHYLEEDLLWLRDEYNEWESGNNINSVALRKAVEDICRVRLTIRKKTADGKTVKPDYDVLQKLINDAALKPRDNLSVTDNRETIGMTIKRLEKTRPADSVELKRKFNDLDGFNKIIRTQLVAPMLKSLGHTENSYVKEMEEFNKDFAISEEDLQNIGVALKLEDDE